MKKNKPYQRRAFLGDIVKAGAAGLLAMPAIQAFQPAKTFTVDEIIELILQHIPGDRPNPTVDNIKSGRGDRIVSGIVTTMFATVPVIEEAARQKANFIIAHEPTFYNHTDDLHWVENNQVVREKQALLDKHQITVWRFHDNWHRLRPDGILHGVLLKTGWLKLAPGETMPFKIPTQSLGDIAEHLKKTLGIPHLRVIGKLSTPCSNLTIMPGAAGGQRQVAMAEHPGTDLLIVGECNEWETPEYVRDAQSFGKPISLIVLGHAFSEEPGMEWLVEWLQPKIPAVPVIHVPSGEPWQWL